jgi:hypothetical protein
MSFEHYARLELSKVSREDRRRLASLPTHGALAAPPVFVARLVPPPVRTIAWDEFATVHGIDIRPRLK